ncbi:hypothetical protein J0H33_00270, partial [bacterium]|nr:hypothetical protein [bacterium]
MVYIAAEHTQRNALAIATSRIGLGLDLSADIVRITASRAALEQLAAVLGGSDDALAADLARYLSPVAAWELRTGSLELSRAHVMGIVNLTTD